MQRFARIRGTTQVNGDRPFAVLVGVLIHRHILSTYAQSIPSKPLLNALVCLTAQDANKPAIVHLLIRPEEVTDTGERDSTQEDRAMTFINDFISQLKAAYMDKGIRTDNTEWRPCRGRSRRRSSSAGIPPPDALWDSERIASRQ